MFKYFRSTLIPKSALRFYQQKFDSQKDYYKVMGVSSTASEAEIKKAYRNLVVKYHPDKKGGSESKIKEINEAKEVLLHGDIKKQYDEARRSGSSQGSSYGGQAHSQPRGSSQYNSGYSSSYQDQSGRQRNTRFYDNANWGADAFAEFYKKAQRQQQAHERQQQAYERQQQQANKAQGRARKRFYIYRDRYGNEYVVEDNGNGPQDPDPRYSEDSYRQQQRYRENHQTQEQYSASGGQGFEGMGQRFKDFAESVKNSSGVFDEILKEQKEKAMREEEFMRQQQAQRSYSNVGAKEVNLGEDFNRAAKKAKDAWDVFRYSSENKGIFGGLKDALTFVVKGDKKK